MRRVCSNGWLEGPMEDRTVLFCTRNPLRPLLKADSIYRYGSSPLVFGVYISACSGSALCNYVPMCLLRLYVAIFGGWPDVGMVWVNE